MLRTTVLAAMIGSVTVQLPWEDGCSVLLLGCNKWARYYLSNVIQLNQPGAVVVLVVKTRAVVMGCSKLH